MTPEQIRDAVGIVTGSFYDQGRTPPGLVNEKTGVVHRAALKWAESLDDPIWWCFEHGSNGSDYECTKAHLGAVDQRDCDIALATRPRRIE